MQNTSGSLELPARTHAEAAALLRRPFAPGAIGFRAMTKVPLQRRSVRRRPGRRLHRRPVRAPAPERRGARALAPGVPAARVRRRAPRSCTWPAG